MNIPEEQARASSSWSWGQTDGPGDAAFQFDCGDDWMRMSADFGRLGPAIAQQVRKAMAEVDVDAIADDIRRAMTGVADEIRQAMDTLASSPSWSGPTRVRVDIHAEGAPEQPAAGPTAPPADLSQERMTILTLVAQNKITAGEAARLLDALGD